MCLCVYTIYPLQCSVLYSGLSSFCVWSFSLDPSWTRHRSRLTHRATAHPQSLPHTHTVIKWADIKGLLFFMMHQCPSCTMSRTDDHMGFCATWGLWEARVEKRFDLLHRHHHCHHHHKAMPDYRKFITELTTASYTQHVCVSSLVHKAIMWLSVAAFSLSLSFSFFQRKV